MSDIVFILGAGASKSAGSPLMGDFLDVAKRLQRQGDVTELSDHFSRVFDAIDGLQSVHSKAALDLDNIESIFTVLELGRVIRRVPGLDSVEQIDEVIESLKRLIVCTLQVTMQFPLQGSQVYPPKEYSEFADLLLHLRGKAFPSKSVSVITFNYDIGLDVALSRSGLGPNYRLDAPKGIEVQNVDLLKLHGSLNWATESVTLGSAKKIHPVPMRDYLNRYTSQSYGGERTGIRVPIGDQLQKYFTNFGGGLSVDPTPLIVPPSWNKADYHEDLSDVWSAAAMHLSEAEHIFVMGYSLPITDAFFRHLYALGSVGKQRLSHFVVFDPDPSKQVDERFKKLLGEAARARYAFHSEKFGTAIQTVRGLFPARK